MAKVSEGALGCNALSLLLLGCLVVPVAVISICSPDLLTKHGDLSLRASLVSSARPKISWPPDVRLQREPGRTES